MAFKANFYNFAKKQNSTATPTGTGTEYDISFKAATDIMAPTISVKYAGNPCSFNYLKIPTFNRYYWITRWVYDSGLWYASCKCDVLATFKTAIGTSVQYVKRAYSSYDTDIIDAYPRKAGSTVIQTTGSSGFVSSLASMTYIIGVTSASPNHASIGTTVYYAMSYSDIRDFVANLVSMGYATFTEITDNLSKWICNPFQWIKSVVVLPVSFGAHSWTSVGAIHFGADENGDAFSFYPQGTCYVVDSSSSVNLTYTLTVPKHPDIDVTHNYLQAEPFSNYSIVIPPFGKLQIPSAILYDKTDLYALIRIDPVTGGGSLFLSDDSLHYGSIALAESQVGVSLPVDAAVVDLAAAGVGTLIGGGASAISTAVNGGNLEGILSSFIDGALSSMSKVQTISTGGKLCDLGLPPLLFLEYFTIIGQDPENYGYPLAQRTTINTLSGFVLCDNAEVAISGATYDEMREIESYLDSGFFYE